MELLSLPVPTSAYPRHGVAGDKALNKLFPHSHTQPWDQNCHCHRSGVLGGWGHCGVSLGKGIKWVWQKGSSKASPNLPSHGHRVSRKERVLFCFLSISFFKYLCLHVTHRKLYFREYLLGDRRPQVHKLLHWLKLQWHGTWKGVCEWHSEYNENHSDCSLCTLGISSF